MLGNSTLTPKLSKSQRLARLTARYPSQAKIQMYRNMFLSGGGVSLLIILVVAEGEFNTTASFVSLCGASVAMPSWLCLAGMYEYYIFIGSKSYKFFRSGFNQFLVTCNLTVGAVGLLTGICGLIIHTNEKAIVPFIFGSLFAFLILAIHHFVLAHSIFKNEIDDEDVT